MLPPNAPVRPGDGGGHLKGDELPKGDWQPIASAPMTGPVLWVDTWNGREVQRAHYACDLSGEYQPAFQGWFSRGGKDWHKEVSPPPTHWRVGSEARHA